ncbi:MAG TPA: hypothetical protein VJT13_04630 [Xanthobacteraceae bacterium]|nr:hypothetical protein [Xanthobacteraceae bacterium]
MHHYYFHLISPAGRDTDDVGNDFPDAESAYLGAHQAALDISVEMLNAHDGDPARHSFEITDADGLILFELPFSEVINPSKKPALDAFHANLRRTRERNDRATTNLRTEFARTRSLLSDTKELLVRADSVLHQ